MFGKKLKETVLAYKRVFDSPDGQLVLKDLMRCSNMNSSTVGADPYETYFNEGARSIVLRITKTTAMSLNDIEQYLFEIEKGDLDE